VAVIVLIAAPIDALFAAAGLRASAWAVDAHAVHRFVVWWLTDALGMLLIAPALLAWFGDVLGEDDEPRSRDQTLLDAPAFFLTALVVVASFTVSLFGHRPFAYALLFLYFPIVAWI